MASSVVFEEQIEVPFFRSLADFRVWATSDDFPEKVRVDFITGRIEVDMSPEDLFSHGSLKMEIARVLGDVLKVTSSGYLFSDSTRISCPEADLSVEPDVVFISEKSLDSGRVRLVPKATREPDRYVEVEGPPDLIVEIVSDSSETKDTQRLPAAYYRAGAAEFWLIDARGEELLFQIHRPGPSAYEPARKLTAEKVAEAIRKLRTARLPPYKPALPMRVAVRFKSESAAETAAKKPGVRRTDAYTVQCDVKRQCDVVKWLTGTGVE